MAKSETERSLKIDKRGASRISVIFYGSSLYAILPWR
jgi:hypothetical protein